MAFIDLCVCVVLIHRYLVSQSQLPLAHVVVLLWWWWSCCGGGCSWVKSPNQTANCLAKSSLVLFCISVILAIVLIILLAVD
jgi:hypothetical protein